MDEDTKHSVTRQATLVGEVEPVTHLDRTTQLCFSRTTPSLETFDHVRLLSSEYKLIPHKERKCKYCQYLVALARVKKEPLPVLHRPRKQCRICEVNLCDNHKDFFQAKQYYCRIQIIFLFIVVSSFFYYCRLSLSLSFSLSLSLFLSLYLSISLSLSLSFSLSLLLSNISKFFDSFLTI